MSSRRGCLPASGSATELTGPPQVREGSSASICSRRVAGVRKEVRLTRRGYRRLATYSALPKPEPMVSAISLMQERAICTREPADSFAGEISGLLIGWAARRALRGNALPRHVDDAEAG